MRDSLADEAQDQQLARDRQLVLEFNTWLPRHHRLLLHARWMFSQLSQLIAEKQRHPIRLPKGKGLDEEEEYQLLRKVLLDSLTSGDQSELETRIALVLPKCLGDVTDGKFAWDTDAANAIEDEFTRLCAEENLLRYKEVPGWYFWRAESAIENIRALSQHEYLLRNPLKPVKQIWDESLAQAKATVGPAGPLLPPPWPLALPSGLETTDTELSSGFTPALISESKLSVGDAKPPPPIVAGRSRRRTKIVRGGGPKEKEVNCDKFLEIWCGMVNRYVSSREEPPPKLAEAVKVYIEWASQLGAGKRFHIQTIHIDTIRKRFKDERDAGVPNRDWTDGPVCLPCTNEVDAPWPI